MAQVTLASLQAMRKELVNSRYYLNIRSGYMAPVTLHCSYGDSGETITFYLFDGGDELDLTDASVSVHGTRKDGANFGPFACTVDGNSVSFTLHSTMTAVEGGGIAEISISKNGSTIGSANFGIMVEDAAFPNGVAYDSDPSVYQDILKYCQESYALINASLSQSLGQEIQGRITGDTSLSSQVNYLSTRLDNAINAGSLADNEVQEARTGQNGYKYSTLGAAIRGQFDENYEVLRKTRTETDNVNLLELNSHMFDGLSGASGSSYTVNGITFTLISHETAPNYVVNGDRIIRVTGTVTSGRPYLDIAKFKAPRSGRYYLYGSPGQASNTTALMYIQGTTAYDMHSTGAYYYLQQDVEYRVRIVVYEDATISNWLFRPSLIWVGNSGKEAELAKTVATNENLLQLTGKTYAFTNGSNTLTIDYTNGGLTAHLYGNRHASTVVFDIGTFRCPKTGTYKLSGIPSSGQKFFGYLQGDQTPTGPSGANDAYDRGSGGLVILTENKQYTYRLVINGSDGDPIDYTFAPKVVYTANHEDRIVALEGGSGGGGGGEVSTYSCEIAYIANDTLGDTNLIKFSNGKTMLIDSGIVGQWTNIKAKINSQNVTHLDYFILSHWHEDHCGNMQNLINEGYLDAESTIYLPPDLDSNYDQTPYPDADRTKWKSIIQKNVTIKPALQNAGCTLVYPNDWDELTIGGCKIIFCNCDHTSFYGTSNNYNDWSLCNFLICGNTTIFFAGDIGPIAQNKIGGTLYKANILKSQHHGWDNGVNNLIPAYINNLDPEVVISEDSEVHISAGYFETNRTPMQSWCECNGRPHYRVHLNGNMITMHVDSFGWHFTSKCSKYIRGTGKNWKFRDNSEYIES